MDMQDLDPSSATAVSDVNVSTKLKYRTKDDYGTSSRGLNDAEEKKEEVHFMEFLSCRRILHAMAFLGFAVAYLLQVSDDPNWLIFQLIRIRIFNILIN